MRLLINSILCDLALHLVAFASAAPSPLVGVRTLDGTLSGSTIVITPSELSASTITAHRYEPSTEWQKWATVEIWAGGDSRKPVNFGDIRGSNLSDQVFDLLNKACPPSPTGCCPGWPKHPTDWQSFWTNSLVEGDPSWRVNLRKARVRIEKGCFHNENTRVVMLQLAADTLRAYTRYPKGYNCYDVPGRWEGIYCNVPKLVRVNLPPSEVNGKKIGNFMHIETWSTDAVNQIGFTKGQLRPCKTRKEVDKVMDKYQGDLVSLFPQWKGKFRRDAQVIIDGYKVCSGEP